MKLLKLCQILVKLSCQAHFAPSFRPPCAQSLWIDDTLCRFLFSIILLVIVFFWRPSAINQRDLDQNPPSSLLQALPWAGAEDLIGSRGPRKAAECRMNVGWEESHLPVAITASHN
uniref:Uncharacterized protein n=1 Tax=Podarcis muralis TaxID=64176 RepID=A0A670JEN5_PODMU